jgi:hypothetical protein
VILGLFGLMFWYRWAPMLLDLRYGNSFLTYESFPFSLGGTLRARLRSPRISAIGELTLTLRGSCRSKEPEPTCRGM